MPLCTQEGQENSSRLCRSLCLQTKIECEKERVRDFESLDAPRAGFISRPSIWLSILTITPLAMANGPTDHPPACVCERIPQAVISLHLLPGGLNSKRGMMTTWSPAMHARPLRHFVGQMPGQQPIFCEKST